MSLGTQVFATVSACKDGAASFRAGHKIDICRALDKNSVIAIREGFINLFSTGFASHVPLAFIAFALTEMAAVKLLVASFRASCVLVVSVPDVAYSRTGMSTSKPFSTDFLTASLWSGLEIFRFNYGFDTLRMVLAIYQEIPPNAPFTL